MHIGWHLHHLFHPIHIGSHRIDSPDHYNRTDSTRENTEKSKSRITAIKEGSFCIAGGIHRK